MKKKQNKKLAIQNETHYESMLKKSNKKSIRVTPKLKNRGYINSNYSKTK